MKLIKISAFLMLIIISCSKVKSEADKITREYIEKYKPDITVKSASIDNMTLSDITLNTLLEIKNNLPFEIPIEKLEINNPIPNNYILVPYRGNNNNTTADVFRDYDITELDEEVKEIIEKSKPKKEKVDFTSDGNSTKLSFVAEGNSIYLYEFFK